MYVIVGLGNPGARYRGTFHNIGFAVVDALAKKCGVRFTGKECAALTAKGSLDGIDFVLAKPQTFMNLSGESVKRLMKKYGYASELLVIYDDADLPVGRMRLREEGSAGTHNGMRNIVSQLGRTDFKRLRIGIKTQELAEKEVEIIDFVLSKPDFDTKVILDASIDAAAEAIAELISGADIQRVEEKINKRNR